MYSTPTSPRPYAARPPQHPRYSWQPTPIPIPITTTTTTTSPNQARPTPGPAREEEYLNRQRSPFSSAQVYIPGPAVKNEAFVDGRASGLGGPQIRFPGQGDEFEMYSHRSATPQRWRQPMPMGSTRPYEEVAAEVGFKSAKPPLLYEDHFTRPDDLKRSATEKSIQIPAELFEKIYLSPANQVKGELRRTFANPTPLALIGNLLALTPLSCDLMGWRGAGGGGAASVGVYYFCGGLLMLLGGLGEWIIGNTFPFVVFASFGGFWLSLGATLTPSFNAWGAYSSDPSNPAAGQTATGYLSSWAFFLLFMSLLSLIYLLCALRTNICNVLIFLFLILLYAFLAAADWQLANGNASFAGDLTVAAGVSGLCCCVVGWWVFVAVMLEGVEMPWGLPVGDLSKLIRPKKPKVDMV